MKYYINRVVSIISITFILLFIFGFSISEDEKVIADFSLTNVDGTSVSLSNYSNAKGFIVVFTCNHCPFAKLYPPRFNEMNLKYKALGVPLIAISSTDTISYENDTFGKMRDKAIKEHFNFPYLFDGNQTVAANFKAQKTPHAFVIWKVNGQWIVKYNGAIDDNGMEPEKVKNHYVTNAVDDLLKGEVVKEKETKSIGCQIYLRK